MANKKQPAKKRAYVKKSAKWTKGDARNAIHNIELLEWPKSAANKDTEVESLAAICSIFDNWNEDQKRRNLTYLCGRYYDFM